MEKKNLTSENENSPVYIKFYSCSVVKKINEEKYLLVKEPIHIGKNVWYFPGGKVDKGETFEEGAIRETLEEGGISVTLEGILRIEHNKEWGELRILFAATSSDVPKQTVDNDSQGASWISISDLNKFKMRDKDLIPAFLARDQGATIYVMNNFFIETKLACFSTNRSPDPFFMSSCLFIQSKDHKYTLAKIQKSEDRTHYQFIFFKFLNHHHHYEECARQLMTSLIKETFLKMNLVGVIGIKHVPLKDLNTPGELKTLFLVESEYFEENELPSADWNWIETSQVLKKMSSEDSDFILVQNFLNRNEPKYYPLSIFVNSIYSVWTKKRL